MVVQFSKRMSEAAAAANLADLLQRANDAEQHPKLPDTGVTLHVDWDMGRAFHGPHDALRAYAARRLAPMLPQLQADYIDSCRKDVEAARENLAEIQARK